MKKKMQSSPVGVRQNEVLTFLASQKYTSASNPTLRGFFDMDDRQVRSMAKALSRRGLIIYLSTRGGPGGGKSVSALTDAGIAHVRKNARVSA
jgi:hypothetical protein